MKEGTFEIKGKKTARDAWELFFSRFYSSEIPDDVTVKFDPTIKEFSPRNDKNAKNQSWDNHQGREFHSDDFDDFLNGNIIRIPDEVELNENELKKLSRAIHDGYWEHPLFKNQYHVFYAVTWSNRSTHPVKR